MQLKLRTNRHRVAAIETVLRELLLFHQPNVAVGLVGRPANVVDALDTLQEGSDAFQSVGQFHGNGVEVNATTLLEVSELGDLKTI